MINRNKEEISTKQAIFIVILFTIGTSIILTGTVKAKQDIWISITLSTLAVIPMLYVYSKILSFFPGKNVFEILEISCGKIIGTMISLLFILYFLVLATLCLRNITEFIQVVAFRHTPQFFSGIWVILVSSYMVKSGIETFGRWANMACVFLLAMIFGISILSVNHFDIDNLLPILYEGWDPIIESAISVFSFPFGETVIFLALLNTLKEAKNTFKVLSISTLIGGLLILIVIIRSVIILGTPLIDNTYFPTYYANTIVTIGSFIESAAIASSIILLIAGLAKFSTCLFAICIGLENVFNTKRYSIFALPVSVIVLIISQLIFNSTMEMMDSFNYYPYYAIPFQVILPLIVLLIVWIRKKA